MCCAAVDSSSSSSGAVLSCPNSLSIKPQAFQSKGNDATGTTNAMAVGDPVPTG